MLLRRAAIYLIMFCNALAFSWSLFVVQEWDLLCKDYWINMFLSILVAAFRGTHLKDECFAKLLFVHLTGEV